MKAIHLTAYGNPAQNLKMVEVSEPNALSANEALVRMEYAPIAYSDLLLANGVYLLNPELPSVIGAAERFDAGGEPVGEVGQGAILDLAVLAEGFAQENGGRGVAIGDG